MIFLNYFRNKAFWVLDTLKGSSIKNQLEEVNLIFENPTSEKALQLRANYLNDLLEHATHTTPFYKEFAGVTNIEDFPVIRKTVIQDNFEAFQSSTFIDKKNYKVSTSGSTGVPFFLFQNKRKRHRNTADVLYFSKLNDFILGNRLYELEVWREHNKKGAFKSWLQNVKQFDISKLTDERIQEFIELLKASKQPKNMLGFASAYELICQYLDRTDVQLGDLNIRSIIANSEYLNAYTKTTMSKHFNAPVLSRYSSEEIGIVAHQTLQFPDQFKINHASYYVELLDLEQDVPVKEGEFGRIVVTDFFNHAMPIIRYDTGDIAKMIKDENGVINFEKIEGRKMDLIYDTKGQIISSFVVYTKFYEYYRLLKQYQFIQKGEKDYQVKLNLHNGFPHEQELIDSIKNDFGNDANVEIEYVDEIPTLPSGKRKKVVNNFHIA